MCETLAASELPSLILLQDTKHMEESGSTDFGQNALFIARKLMETYWSKLYNYLVENPELIKTFPHLLLHRDRLVFYFGKTHLAIEYFGAETGTELLVDGTVNFQIFDYTNSDENFIEQIIGFKYNATTRMPFPLPDFAEDLVIPTSKGLDKLIELGWNFDAQNALIALNVGKFYFQQGEPGRWVNSLFFDANENGLKTRHIKWIDFIPLNYDDSDADVDRMELNLNHLLNFVEHDAHYRYPLPKKEDYKFVKLPQVNRFIELAGAHDSSETDITTFLDRTENRFIISMAFLGTGIYPQLQCDWQSEAKDPIKPDYFVVGPNGYANIVEFKLPKLKSNSITGRNNRETFSAEINSYISQTRVYKTYFDDPNNRTWFEKKYGFKVHQPKRILVMGRRFDFSDDEWREIIADYRDVEIMTYDDLANGVVAQFYL